MRNIVVAVAPLIFLFGCQTPNNSNWLTASKGSEGLFLGQAPVVQSPFGEPFGQAVRPAPATPIPTLNPFAPVQQDITDSNRAAREAELERIRILATTPRPGAPEQLQPFAHRDGPFANRERGRPPEQDTTLQVGGSERAVPRVPSIDYEFDWEREEPKRGFDWSVLDPANIVARTRELMGLGPNEEKATESMRQGREILLANPDLQDKRRNLEAAKHFMNAAKRFPDSVLEEDALHLAGECFFFADDYHNAFRAYRQLVSSHQHSKHVDNAVRRLLQIGRFWELESERNFSQVNLSWNNRTRPRFDTFGHAKKAYETIFIHDPLGPVSDVALMALATAYLRRGRYQGDNNFDEAAFYYQQLRETHPTSKYIVRAHKNELYARIRAYMGPEHPSGTLIEAKKLAEMTLWQFRNELSSEDYSAVLALQETILAKEAERLWTKGQFWDTRKQHYGSARMYYRRLIDDYPQTDFAERARSRLVQIEGRPDVPSIFSVPGINAASLNPFRTWR